jgi:NADH-quinone oxidoreductase subunit E
VNGPGFSRHQSIHEVNGSAICGRSRHDNKDLANMTAPVAPAAGTKAPPDAVGLIARKWKNKRGSLIMALHELQETFGYVPREAALKLGPAMDVPVARVYEVLTFYNYFKTEAPGRFVVSVCTGTACHLKGSGAILEEFSRLLGCKEGESTPDKNFHLQGVRCIGCCGIAPAVIVNGTVYPKVKPESVKDIIAKTLAQTTT